MLFEDFANSRVAILGLGREGQAVWRQFRRRYPQQPIALFAETEGDDGFIKLLDPVLDQCHFGPFDVEQLKHFDVLVRSAGISPYRDDLAQLRSLGVGFTTANSLWFAENPDARTICISGTKGKSTTAALTAHLLTYTGVRVALSGNIGRPMLDCDAEAVDWWVIELSSYQLSDLEAEPDMVLLLNLSDEHIDWHGSSERYRADKLKLAAMAGETGLIANAADEVLCERLAGFDDVIWFNGDVGWRALEDGVTLNAGQRVYAPASLPGEHNMHNLAAALTVVDVLGLEISDINQALETFTGLPHRLQVIGKKDGITYVDDSISTTPVSVVAALQTVGVEAVVLLLGGLDRGLDWGDFCNGLAGNPPQAIITMPDSGSNILECLRNAGVEPPGGLHAAEGLSQAVALAQNLVPENGCILLSPGAPSFPHFRDFEDRGDQFACYAGIEKGTLSTH